MSTKKVISHAISAVIALGVAGSAAASTMEAPKGMEKCYGVAKAGMNDCGTASHDCGGSSKVDGDKEAWITVPSGLCQKIVGGSTKS